MGVKGSGREPVKGTLAIFLAKDFMDWTKALEKVFQILNIYLASQKIFKKQTLRHT